MADESNKTSQDESKPQTFCGGKTKEEWGWLLFFYFCFYGVLIAFFAICYQVMFYTLPDRQSQPKLNNLIQPGLVLFPSDVSIRSAADLNSEAFRDSFLSEMRDLDRFGDRTPFTSKFQVEFGDRSRFGDCAETLMGVTNSTYQQLRPCFFAKLNRVWNFPDADKPITTNVTLDFPSQEDFEEEHGISFAEFREQHIMILPDTVTPTVPFENDPSSAFQDVISAVQLNFTKFEADIKSGALKFDFRLGVQFDFGQSLGSGGNGYNTIDIDVRSD